MRVLVTGNNGYIGTVMVPLLQSHGFDVSGLDSDLFEGSTFGDASGEGKISEIPYLKKDVRDVEVSDLKGIDAVVHLCALSNDPLGNFNPDLTNEINFLASVRFAKLAKKAGVRRFVFSSSCSVYGASTEEIVTEQSATNPVTPYGESKLRVEQSVSKLADSDFCPTFMRSATAYGVSPMLRCDLVLNNLTAWAYTKKLVFLKSDGTPWRPIVHVQDISRAFVAVLDAPKDLVNNEVFNIGRTEENYRIREIANIVKETVPDSRIEYAKDAEPDKRSYRVDFTKIATVLRNFKPEWNARLGANQLFEAFKKAGLILEDFEGFRYRRITNLENSILSGRLDKTLRRRGVEASKA
jgi:nucleoside-diphosphate-sugar epimerase